ncbi:bifunctional riboflavin kinase/FAD synthetase [Clostridium oceanicum]|uniref:Riboflavin biosynthesis protein n=2 Tax=Clostridium oceanicum TaxID=1543 RepID=A0ABP3UL85_9CLOT
MVIEDNFTKKLDYNTFIALGSFDGIHRGHQKLIEQAVKLAKKYDSKSMVLTFKEHPLNTINKEAAPKIILDNKMKSEILKKQGIDIVNYINFNKDYMEMSPEEFITNIIRFYNAKGIVVGFNFRFGYKNLGDVGLLKKLSEKLNFKLKIVEPVTYKNEVVSSSRIRHAIAQEGNMRKANEMLSKCYTLRGVVKKGKQLGRTWGFPTVNLSYDNKYILPRGGVYYTLVEYHNNVYQGITNVGYNPTLDDGKLSIETHMLGFDKDIYGAKIAIKFIKKIREEKKFASTDELASQLEKDKNYALSQKYKLNCDKLIYK